MVQLRLAQFLISLSIVMSMQQALKTSRLKDDTTCVVVNIIPSDHLTSPQLSPKKNQNKLKSLFRRRSHTSVGKLGGKSASIGSVLWRSYLKKAVQCQKKGMLAVPMLHCILLCVNFFVIDDKYHFLSCYSQSSFSYWIIIYKAGYFKSLVSLAYLDRLFYFKGLCL